MKLTTTICKATVRFVGIFGGVSPFLADWNKTHIYNPAWPPHAKFHNAQTMLMGALLASLTVFLLRRKVGDQKFQFLLAAFVASLYWLSQAGSILFPGTDFTDPDLKGSNAHFLFGLPGQQGLELIVFSLLGLAVFFYLRFGVERTAKGVTFNGG